MECSIKWAADGEQRIEVLLPTCKVIAEPEILFRVMHIFLEGYPDYENGGDQPNEFDPDIENRPATQMKL